MNASGGDEMEEINDRFKNWGATGVEVPNLGGSYFLPPGENGDKQWRSLLADALSCLYSAVGSAQQAPKSNDDQRNAVHQLLVANAALAASEADAFLTLISSSLEKPAEVHLRALGEMVRRMVLCREKPELALVLYGSAEPSWRKLAEKMGAMAISAPENKEKDMRQIEMSGDFKAAIADVIAKYHLLNDLEWTMWSKRSHGDIYALVEVSQALTVRDADIRLAVNKTRRPEIEVNAMLNRAIGFTLMGLGAIVSEFEIDTKGRAQDISENYKRLRNSGKIA